MSWDIVHIRDGNRLGDVGGGDSLQCRRGHVGKVGSNQIDAGGREEDRIVQRRFYRRHLQQSHLLFGPEHWNATKNQILSLVRLVVHNGVAGERCQLTFHLLVLALEHFIGLQRRLQLSVDFFQFFLRFKSREGTPTLYFDCILVIRFRSRDSVFPSLPSMLCHNRWCFFRLLGLINSLPQSS